ncbi:MAG: helix-turn-helix domain-containing protein [Halalkalicoccus sp.]
MSDSQLQACEECVPPAEAFSAIASETRLEILEALWDAPERPVSFSELHDRVDVRDSAQFNYHLKRLVGQFVVRTDEGYDLRHAGESVIQAVLSGSFNRDPDRRFGVEGECVDCAGPLEARYRDEHVTIDCLDCGQRHGQYAFPPGGLTDRTDEEVAAAFDQRVRHLHCLAADGVCPACNGRMETTIRYAEECCLKLDLLVEHRCLQCRHELCSTPGLRLVEHSAVVSFYRDHGLDLGAIPYWQLPWCVSDEYVTVRSEEPWRLRVRIALDDEELRVDLDDDLAVQAIESLSTA